MSDPTSDATRSSGITANGTNGAAVLPAEGVIVAEDAVRRLESIAAGHATEIAEPAPAPAPFAPQAMAPPAPAPVMPSPPRHHVQVHRVAPPVGVAATTVAPARPAALTPGLEEAMRAVEAAAPAAVAPPASSADAPPPVAPHDPAARPDARGILTVARHDLWNAVPENWARAPQPPYFWSPHVSARDFDCAPLVGVLMSAHERRSERGLPAIMLRFMNLRPLPATRGPTDPHARMIGAHNIVIVECTHDLDTLVEAARHPSLVCEVHLKPVIDEWGGVSTIIHVGRRDIKRDLFAEEMRRVLGGAPAAGAGAAGATRRPAEAEAGGRRTGG